MHEKSRLGTETTNYSTWFKQKHGMVLVIFFFNWDSLHARLTEQPRYGVTRTVWSYKKKKHKKSKHIGNLYSKNLKLIGL